MSVKSAVLIIDVQMGLVEGSVEHQPIFQKDKLLTNLEELLAKAREAAVPVIYVQDDDVAPVGTSEWQVHPRIAPQQGDLAVRKVATDSFHRTKLYEELQARGITHLTIAGCKTEYCVDSACKRASTLGFEVTLVGDAHSTTDNGVLTAQQIINHHNRHLHRLYNVDNMITVKDLHELTF